MVFLAAALLAHVPPNRIAAGEKRPDGKTIFKTCRASLDVPEPENIVGSVEGEHIAPLNGFEIISQS